MFLGDISLIQISPSTKFANFISRAERENETVQQSSPIVCNMNLPSKHSFVYSELCLNLLDSTNQRFVLSTVVLFI